MSTINLEGGAISREMVDRVRGSRARLAEERLVPIEGMASYFVSASNGDNEGYEFAFNIPVDGEDYYIYLKH